MVRNRWGRIKGVWQSLVQKQARTNSSQKWGEEENEAPFSVSHISQVVRLWTILDVLRSATLVALKLAPCRIPHNSRETRSFCGWSSGGGGGSKCESLPLNMIHVRENGISLGVSMIWITVKHINLGKCSVLKSKDNWWPLLPPPPAPLPSVDTHSP